MDKQTEKLLNLLHIFGANLILQVFGGAGAVWGFSEVIGLRTPETVWLWRPVAQFVGAVFFARWILELDAHLKESGTSRTQSIINRTILRPDVSVIVIFSKATLQ